MLLNDIVAVAGCVLRCVMFHGVKLAQPLAQRQQIVSLASVNACKHGVIP